MQVCPKCKTKYPEDNKQEYCVCGTKIPATISFPDIFSDEAFTDIFNDKKDERE